MNTALILLTLLFTKHFIVDFPLQRAYQWKNKGTYGHPGGVLHAELHGVFTFACVYWYAPEAACYLAFTDMLIHYHIDWAKMNINKRYGWESNTHEEFWWLLGLDQLLHSLTYIGLVALIT